MQIVVKDKGVNLSEDLKNYTTNKISKLEKFFKKIIEVQVVLSKTSAKKNKLIFSAEVTIFAAGSTIRAQERSEDLRTAIDLVYDKLERQISKYKEKLVQRHRNLMNENFLEQKSEEVVHENKIVKTKKFPLKPITPEEAIIDMELLGHNFYVFINSQTMDVNVIYKRNEGGYGLIEPEK
ncbi:sigma 54 modulation protein/ribosomal protein S30EA [Thermodesulfobium narugense DSM 14796]|uniref:Ribosome hibernation promoting factor n=1 Tax=Thermodesulfobium narugense DSM 14796 TaxID=747365 RepID=M1E6Z6_9BACT|nr:ribosome-associated translation inhibitor RaiA [Thermodesulfobium narugense]AEE14398.1 sigma 54 modulation protein/ribosomal protein S30EA [Thermodesulfobium narugense DSM 14796]